MEKIYFPSAAPANITDLATGTRNLDKEGLMSLRQADDLPPGDPDLPPPGSRGEPGDVAAPFASAEETIKNLYLFLYQAHHLGYPLTFGKKL